jgi:hypothetical protein
MSRRSVIAALVVGLVMVGLTVAVAQTTATDPADYPDGYSPPCTSDSTGCIKQRVAGLEAEVDRLVDHYRAHSHATPTPTPTVSPTPTPTVTPTAEPSPTQTCTNPAFVTTATDNNGDGATFDGPGGPYFLHNNMWNNHAGSGPTGTYTMSVCSHDNWLEVANQLPSTISPGAVRAYPNVHKDYNDEPLSNVHSARFAHNTTKVDGMVWNVAFDVWINDNFDNELMIWTENHNQRPAGAVVAPTVTIGGQDYELWRLGSGTGTGGIFTYLSKTTQTYGTMPLHLFFADLQQRGWLEPRAGGGLDTTWQVDYGVEVVDTNGVDHRWNFNDFEIFDATNPPG